MSIFKPVFDTVWKRTETKLFLAVAIIYPLIFLASTYLPEGSNFMVPQVEGDFRFGLMDMFSVMFSIGNDLTIPAIALSLLTFSVFRSEMDSHLMFLYKDIKRRDIFVSKLLSLFAILLVYVGIYLVMFVFIHYGRTAYMPYGTPGLISDDVLGVFNTLGTIVLQYVILVFLSAFLSMKVGRGATLGIAFAFSLMSSLLPLIGGPIGKLFPAGYYNFETYDGNLLPVVSFPIMITLIYSSLLVVPTFRTFKKMEY